MKDCQGVNSSSSIHRIYKEHYIKTVNLQMRKNELTEWKVLKQHFFFFFFLNFRVCVSFSYRKKETGTVSNE